MNLSDELKASIRATIYAIGWAATEKEFSEEYYKMHQESIYRKMQELKYESVGDFFRAIPDICKVLKVDEHGKVVIERVSVAATAHLDYLTNNNNKKGVRKELSHLRFYSYYKPSDAIGAARNSR